MKQVLTVLSGIGTLIFGYLVYHYLAAPIITVLLMGLIFIVILPGAIMAFIRLILRIVPGILDDIKNILLRIKDRYDL